MWTLTRKSIGAHSPCSDDYADALKLFPRRRKVSFIEVAAQEAISTDNLVWLLRCCASDQIMRLIACEIAEHCQPAPVPTINATAIAVSRRYAFGLAAASAASAASASAASAACAAAAEAESAACSSAYFAFAAAYFASTDSACACASAERSWQRKLMIAVATDPKVFIETQRGGIC